MKNINPPNEVEIKEKFVALLKEGTIRLGDVPHDIRDEVAKEVFGRYPLKNFSELKIVQK